MDPEYGQTPEFLSQFPDNKNVVKSENPDSLEFDLVINLNGLKEKSHIVIEESEDEAKI